MKTKLYSALLTLLALAAAAALAGCASPAARIKANPQLFASISPANQELIRHGQIALGFTPDMVLLALGEPDRVTQHTDASGTTEMWRYQNVDNNSSTYFYAGWGGPYFSPYRGWGYYGSWGYPAWGWTTTVSDYLRINFQNGRVTEINRLR